jgi:hypothetical protein
MLLELLIVLVVIAILAGSYFSRNQSTGEQSSYQRTMSRSNDAACKANRATLRSMIEMYRLNNPGKPVTTENLKKAGMNPPSCPQGGVYGFKKDGTILCSIHDRDAIASGADGE